MPRKPNKIPKWDYGLVKLCPSISKDLMNICRNFAEYLLSKSIIYCCISIWFYLHSWKRLMMRRFFILYFRDEIFDIFSWFGSLHYFMNFIITKLLIFAFFIILLQTFHDPHPNITNQQKPQNYVYNYTVQRATAQQYWEIIVIVNRTQKPRKIR